MSSFRWLGKSEDGQTVTLRRLSGMVTPPAYVTPDWLQVNADIVRTGIAIDVETTGLDKRDDKVIEIGLRRFQFNEMTGEILSALDSYQEFQDPGVPLTEEIKSLTGITDDDVKGKAIDWAKIDRWISDADIVIAHNAGFDRPFIEKHAPAAASQVWACSFKQVDWSKRGYRIQKLEVLGIYHGFFWDSHRALSDVDAMVHLLGIHDPSTDKTYLHELVTNAKRPVVRVMAIKAPFASKDFLKSQRYSWEPTSKFWQKFIYRDELEAELARLEKFVYLGEFGGMIQEVALTENFR